VEVYRWEHLKGWLCNMAADGTLIVPNVSPVMGEARGRRVADLGYSRGKVSCKMIQACDVLDILRTKNRNNPKWINTDLYRLLYNPTLHILAYERLKSKPGNMTPGADGETLDGYSMKDIQDTIDWLRTEQYWSTPVRRVYIPKRFRASLFTWPPSIASRFQSVKIAIGTSTTGSTMGRVCHPSWNNYKPHDRKSRSLKVRFTPTRRGESGEP
jgi:hypothetical protein